MAQEKRSPHNNATPKKNVVMSGGTEYEKSMAGDRIVSGTAQRPRPSSVTADDYPKGSDVTPGKNKTPGNKCGARQKRPWKKRL